MISVAINDDKSFLQYVENVLTSNQLGIIPKFSNEFNLQIKLSGIQWNGKSNYQLANFILKLQEEILKAYNLCHNTNYTVASLKKHPELIITVDVKEGCSFWDGKISELLNIIGEGFIKMESTDKRKVLIWLIVCTAISYAGVYGVTSYYTHLKEVELAKLDNSVTLKQEETTQMLLSIISEAQEINNKLNNSHMAYTAKQMHNEDTLTHKNRTYSKQEAEELFAKDEENDIPTPKIFYIDGVYKIPSAYFQDVALDISIDNRKPIKATMSKLSIDERDELCDAFKKANIEGTIAETQMQVTVSVLDGKITEAIIVGLGNARPQSIRMEDIVAETHKTKIKSSSIQGSLFDLPE